MSLLPNENWIRSICLTHRALGVSGFSSILLVLLLIGVYIISSMCCRVRGSAHCWICSASLLRNKVSSFCREGIASKSLDDCQDERPDVWRSNSAGRTKPIMTKTFDKSAKLSDENLLFNGTIYLTQFIWEPSPFPIKVESLQMMKNEESINRDIKRDCRNGTQRLCRTSSTFGRTSSDPSRRLLELPLWELEESRTNEKARQSNVGFGVRSFISEMLLAASIYCNWRGFDKYVLWWLLFICTMLESRKCWWK
jgi:hypothetical protein